MRVWKIRWQKHSANERSLPRSGERTPILQEAGEGLTPSTSGGPMTVDRARHFCRFTRTRYQFLALENASHGCLREPAAHPCVTLILRQKELHHFADASYSRNIGGQTLRHDQHASAGQNFSSISKPVKRTFPFQNFAKCKGNFEIKKIAPAVTVAVDTGNITATVDAGNIIVTVDAGDIILRSTGM